MSLPESASGGKEKQTKEKRNRMDTRKYLSCIALSLLVLAQ